MKEKILILGGTEFVGRLLVEALQEAGRYEIYLFNRGKTNPDLFPEVKRIIGDRETDDIEKLQQEQWDYIVDFSSFYPHSLQRTLDQINRDVKKYIYISTISVYDFKAYDLSFDIKEDYNRQSCSPEEAVDQTMKTYGKKKAACEVVLDEAEWLNAVILRPSVIYGRYDPTDRFYYWLRKLKKANEIIIPNEGEDKLSLTYADDLRSIIQCAIEGEVPNGVYNCNTHEPLSFNSMLSMMQDLLSTDCKLYGLSMEVLRAEKVWLPLSFIRNLSYDNTAIKNATGLTFTPFKASIQSSIDYAEENNWKDCRVGMDEEKEQALLKSKQAESD